MYYFVLQCVEVEKNESQQDCITTIYFTATQLIVNLKADEIVHKRIARLCSWVSLVFGTEITPKCTYSGLRSFNIARVFFVYEVRCTKRNDIAEPNVHLHAYYKIHENFQIASHPSINTQHVWWLSYR